MRVFLSILLILTIQMSILASKSEKVIKEEKMDLILGNWLGNLKINEKNSLRITFTIKKRDDKLIGTMGSPDQLAMNIPIDIIAYENKNLRLELKKLNILFTGKLEKGKLHGVFKQNGSSFPLVLSKIKSINSVKKIYKQTPKKPYPYIEKEIFFKNKKANIVLAGTITYPKIKNKKFPAIILISGSGPNDRNETPMGHFLLLADRLTRHGFAVLRFDKRGIKKSKGNYKKATTYDFASDASSAIDYLLTKEFINKNKIGLLGHSEGAMIAPIIASERKDVKFIILMGTPGVTGEDILIKQTYDIAKTTGVKEKKLKEMLDTDKKVYKILKTVKNNQNIDKIKEKLLKISPKLKAQLKTLISPWFLEFLKFNPQKYLEKIKIPVLVLSGEKDLQVSAIENNKAIEQALNKAKNNKYEIITFKNLNHLFQTAKMGSPSEYGKLDEIINEKVLDKIVIWLNKNVK